MVEHASSPTPTSDPPPTFDKEPSAAAVAAGDADLVTPLLSSLELLGKSVGIEVDRTTARRAVDDARLDAKFAGPDAWFDELTRAGAAVGLRIRTLRRSARDVVKSARAFVPALSLAAGVHGPVRALALVDHRKGAVRVCDPSGADKPMWVNAEKLASLCGAKNADDKVMWAIGEPLSPLDMLVSLGAGAPSPFARLVSLLRLERDDIGVALVYAAGVGIVSLAAPIGVQALVNTVAFGGLLQPLAVLTLLVFAALAFAAVLRALWAWVVERIQQRVFVRVTIDLAHRLPRLRREAMDNAFGPELVNRFFDVLTVQKGAATLLVDGVSIVLQTAVGMLVLAFYHPLLLAFDVALVVVVAFVLLGLGRSAVKTAVKESKAKYKVAAWLQELTLHSSSFRSSSASAFARSHAEDLLHVWLEARKKHWKILFRQIVGALIVQALASAALLGVGGYLVIDGKLTIGQLVAAELIVTTVVAGIAKLGKQLESFYDLCAGVDKLGQLVDLPLEIPAGSMLSVPSDGPGVRGARVELVDVSYAHPDSPAPLLEHLSLSLAPGDRFAVVGPSGAGKSTLADLIYGLRAPTHGRIDIDGLDVRDLDLGVLREHIALVREIEIFEGTVADNVRVGRTNLNITQVRAALEAVGLYRDIAALPLGLETRLPTGGSPLSRGQSQKLCIARAIAGNPRLIVLDAPLSDLDPLSRKPILDALFDRKAPWTVLVTTHDREALRSLDEIHVIDGRKLRPLRAEDLG